MKYTCNENFFSLDTIESFYWAGFIAADGCIFNNQLNLNTAKYDKSHLQKFVDQMQFEGNICRAKWRNNCGFQIAITSEKLVESVKRFNIVSRKTLIYTFPEW
ncbi:MAG: hypothetical protein HQK96_18960, partial [Nitrospirae bacterium]|nr:hypothetical protein [Nitrospirota bacterium]